MSSDSHFTSSDGAKASVPTGGDAVASSVSGYRVILASGATVWMARMDDESFRLRFENAQGDVTRVCLTPEAMKAVARLYRDLTQPGCRIEGRSYSIPSHWSVIEMVASVVADEIDAATKVGTTPASETPPAKPENTP